MDYYNRKGRELASKKPTLINTDTARMKTGLHRDIIDVAVKNQLANTSEKRSKINNQTMHKRKLLLSRLAASFAAGVFMHAKRTQKLPCITFLSLQKVILSLFTGGSMKSKTERKKLFRFIRLISLGIVLLMLSGLLLFAASILRLDAWHEFDASKILNCDRSLIVYDKDGNEVSVLKMSENRIYISIDSIPEAVRNAFIAAEDVRFYKHPGFDIKRIIGAAIADIKAGSYEQGASTISQQLIKLSHLSSEKTFKRKIEEAILAYQMERQFEKDEILEMYLNYCYFGGGFYGIEAASRGYFGKSASEITAAQGAMLAGILKSPSRYAPHINLEKHKAQKPDSQADEGLWLLEEGEYESSQRRSYYHENEFRRPARYYIDTALLEA